MLGGGLRIGAGGAVLLLVLSVVTGQNFFAPARGRPRRRRRRRARSRPARVAGGGASWSSSSRSCSTTCRTPGRASSRCAGRDYERAKLVLFTRRRAARAAASRRRRWGRSTVPRTQKVYIDLGFYDELRPRFGAPGDFAQAYVHRPRDRPPRAERCSGTERSARRCSSAGPDRRTQLSVRLELQADCFAGVWAHSTQQRDILERGRRRGGPRRRRRGRRRPHPEAATGSVHARDVHARLVAAARRVVPARARVGRPRDCDTLRTARRASSSGCRPLALTVASGVLDSPPAMEVLLDVRDLQTQFRTRAGVVRAVDGVSWDVRAGETVALVGESGCGKSVSALSVMRLIRRRPGGSSGARSCSRAANLLAAVRRGDAQDPRARRSP